MKVFIVLIWSHEGDVLVFVKIYEAFKSLEMLFMPYIGVELDK